MSFPDPLSSKFKPSNQNSMEYSTGENKRKLEEPFESKKKISIVKTGRAGLQVFSPKQETPIGSPDSIRSSQSSPTGTPISDDNNNNNNISSKALKNSDIDHETICEIIDVMNDNARKTPDLKKKHSMFYANYGKITNPFPKAENHIHLEGFAVPKKIIAMAQKYNLFWDSKLQKFRREQFSRKHRYERIAAKDLTQELIDKIVKTMCVDEPRGKVHDWDKIMLSINFDKAFHVRGSVLDRIPLWEQLRMVMEDAEENHIILRELMFGIYDIPVPQKFKDYVQRFHTKFTEDAVWECSDKLQKKRLVDLMNSDELAKLKRRILGRFGHDESNYYEKLIKLSYVDAFCDLLHKTLELAEKALAKIIQEKKETILNPKFFDAKSTITLKLIFEVMRHYSLGEYYVWLYCALNYIENDNSRIVAFNIDGPQKNPNSINNFDDQMKILKILGGIFKKAGKAIHTLEFLRSETLKMSAEDELKKVLQAMDKGRLGHATQTPYTNNPTPNLIQMQEKAITVEISLTTAVITTGGDILEIPLKTFIESASVSLIQMTLEWFVMKGMKILLPICTGN